MSNNVYQGKVIWFDPKEGYGFLYWEKEKKRQEDLFCHFSDIEGIGFKALEKNQAVLFELGENRNGKQKAIRIRISDEKSE